MKAFNRRNVRGVSPQDLILVSIKSAGVVALSNYLI